MRTTLLAVVALTFTLHLAAQPASFTVFGKACRYGTDTCLTKNTQFSTNTEQPPANRWIYVRLTVPAGQTLNISGFEFLLRSVNAPAVRIETALHAAVGTSPGAKIYDGTTIFVDSTQRWCPTWFPARSYPANTILYLAYRNPASMVSLGATNAPAGADAQWYAGTVQQPNVKWKYRVLCNGGTPNISSRGGVPRINETFTLYCDNVIANGFSFIMFCNWPIPSGYPLDLTASGAPQCDLNIPVHGYFLVTPPSRVASYSWRIPPVPGLTFGAQWFVGPHGSNALGGSLSEGGRITYGF